MNLSIFERKVGRLTFANPLVFGGGTCKTLEDVKKACGTDVGGVEVGTITKLSRPGNTGAHNFHAIYSQGVLIATLNSLNMPNPGKEAWTLLAGEAIRIAHGSGKKIGINIAGDTPEEIVEMILWAIELGFDWITINGGCPNKFHDGKPVGTLTFDEQGVEQLVELLEIQIPRNTREIWWKPSPFTDTVYALPKSARLIARSNIITGYIANNTVPHCFAWGDDGKQAITFGDGRAGMGGPAVKPISLGHLRTIDAILPGHMARLGSGGVCYGSDIADYLRQKADLVQMTSWVWANYMDYRVANYTLAEFMELPSVQELL